MTGYAQIGCALALTALLCGRAEGGGDADGRAIAARSVRAVPQLPGPDVCSYNDKREATGVSAARLAAALPGMKGRCEDDKCIAATKAYCKALADGDGDAATTQYLEIIAAVYPGGGNLFPQSSAGGRAGSVATTPAGVSWEGALIGGLASFLASRAEAETVAWLLEQLRKRLCSETVSAAIPGRTWFPETCALATDTSGLGSQPPGRLFAVAIRSDIEELPAQVVRFVIEALGRKSVPELAEAFEFFVDAGARIRRRRDPVAALRDVLAMQRYQAACKDFPTKVTPRCVLSTAALLFVHVYPEVRKVKHDIAAEEVIGKLAAIRDKLEPELTELYGRPPAQLVARLWPGNPGDVAVQNQLLRIGRAIQALARALPVTTSDLPATASEGVRRARILLPLVLEVTEAGADLFDLGQVKYRPRLFALLRQLESLAESFDAIAAAGRAIRHGRKPLEIIAGLGRSPGLRRQCKGAKKTVPLGCALATAGRFVEHVAGIASTASGPLGESEVTLLYRAILTMGPLVEDIKKLYGVRDVAALPPALARLIDVGQAAEAGVIQPLLELVDTLVTLQSTIKSISESPRDQALQQAPVLLRQIVAVLDAGSVLVGEGSVPYREEMLAVADAVALIIAGDHAQGIQRMIGVVDELIRDAEIQLPAVVRRHLPLAVELASARSEEDVRAALESAAAPVGSWRRKHHGLTASITGFVGVMGGRERPQEGGLESSVRHAWAAGAIGAVGIDVSWPCQNGKPLIDFLTIPCPDTWSKGFFISVLDVGQLTWVRLEHTIEGTGTDEVRASTAPEVDVAQVFSPGLYYHLSLGHSPFTLGVGASYAPALRRYFFANPADPPEELLSTYRIGAFLAVDVTILPF